MSFKANTGDYEVNRSDVFAVDPRALIVDWNKNISRGGQPIVVNENLISLAQSMLPKAMDGNPDKGGTGQLHPITCVPTHDKKLRVVGGFRRTRAALYLIESGLCPDFKIKYTVSRLSEAEAAVANMVENLEKEDPSPIQQGHAIRCLTEDYGMSVHEVAKRLRLSTTWIHKLLELVMLPSDVQAAVGSGGLPVSAALELAKVDPVERAEVLQDVQADGKRVTATKVKAARRKSQEKTGAGKPVSRTLKQLREFLESKTGPGNCGRNLSSSLLEFLEGKHSEDQMDDLWEASFT